MTEQEFIQHFAEQLDETEASALTTSTEYRSLDEWSSLVALSVMGMIDDEYDVALSALEMRQTNTIGELYALVASKK